VANETTVLVKYKTDKAALRATESAGKKLVKQQKTLGKTLGEVSSSAKKAVKELTGQKTAARQVEKLTDAEHDLARGIDKATAAQRDFNAEFDRTSKNVALAGDVESNLRAVGGAAGAAGLGGVGTGIGAAAELPALVEALPRLKTSLAGLPSAAKSAASALGPTGIGVGAALVGLVIIAKQVSDEIDKATDSIKGAIDVNRQYAEIVAQGSAEAAQAAVEEAEYNQRVRDIERQGLERSLQIMEKQIDSATGLEQVVIRIGDAVKTMPVEEVENRLKELGEEATQDETLVRRLNQALSDGTIPLQELAGSLDQAAQAASAAAHKQEESAREQEQAQNNAARAAEQAGQRIQQAHQQYADAIENINRQTGQAIEDAQRKSKQAAKDLSKALSTDLADAVIEASRERLGLLRDYYRDEQKEARDNQRELKNIRKEALRSERDAIRSRDFLALAEIAEQAKESAEDTKEQILAERKEREIALEYAKADMKDAQTIQHQERIRDYQRQRQDLRKNLKRQAADIYRGQSRQLEAAARARDKQLQIAQQGANALLKIEGRLWDERQRMAGGRTTGPRTTGPRTTGPRTGRDTLETIRQIGIL